MFTIHLTAPETEPQALRFDKNEITIGRISTADIQLKAANVSKQHSRIVFREGRYFLLDRKSTNGTFLNGQRVLTPQSLKNGDKINIGDCLLVFEAEEEAKLQPAAPPPPIPGFAVPSSPASLKLVPRNAHPEPLKGGEGLLYLEAERNALYEEALAWDEFQTEETFYSYRLDDDAFAETLRAKLDILINERLDASVTGDVKTQLRDHLLYELIGYGLFEKYLYDDQVEEILVNGPEQILLVRHGEKVATEDSFSDDRALQHIIARIVRPLGFSLDETYPFFDVTVPEGFTLRGVLAPASANGTVVRLLKAPHERLSLAAAKEKGLVSESLAALVEKSVKARKTVLVVASDERDATAALSVLTGMIPADERIALVNTGSALTLERQDVLRFETSSDDFEGDETQGVHALLHQAPALALQRLVLARLDERLVADWLFALNGGLDGSLFALYGRDAADGLARLVRMVQAGCNGMPEPSQRSLIAATVPLVVSVERPRGQTAPILAVHEIVQLGSSLDLKKMLY